MIEMIIGLAIAVPVVLIGIPPLFYALSKVPDIRLFGVVHRYLDRWYDYWATRQVREED